MTDTSTLISIVVVTENDRDIVDALVEETQSAVAERFRYYELVLVDNASSDGTAERIQQLLRERPNLRLIRLSRRYEAETALAAALDHSVGDYVVLLEAQCDPPALIPPMVELAMAGSDVVIAERRERTDESWLRGWAARLFYRMAGGMWGYTLVPNASNFRVFSRRVVNSIVQIKNKRRYLKYLNAVVGFRQTTVPYDRRYRRPGPRRGPGSWRSLAIAFDMVVSHSALPLRLASFVGLGASFLSLLFFGYVVLVAIFKERVIEGWITTNVVMACLFFGLFLMVTVLAEYVSRLLEEVQERPLYFIESEASSPVFSYKDEIVQHKGNVV
ncbi:MAG TPA: glycosyltransferase [Candidatus Polarisedimenticolaceae bacterium]|nr:glycosyltransferase [Candidatus Polarisedimenticolaceae bacterium]